MKKIKDLFKKKSKFVPDLVIEEDIQPELPLNRATIHMQLPRRQAVQVELPQSKHGVMQKAVVLEHPDISMYPPQVAQYYQKKYPEIQKAVERRLQQGQYGIRETIALVPERRMLVEDIHTGDFFEIKDPSVINEMLKSKVPEKIIKDIKVISH